MQMSDEAKLQKTGSNYAIKVTALNI